MRLQIASLVIVENEPLFVRESVLIRKIPMIENGWDMLDFSAVERFQRDTLLLQATMVDPPRVLQIYERFCGLAFVVKRKFQVPTLFVDSQRKSDVTACPASGDARGLEVRFPDDVPVYCVARLVMHLKLP